MLTGPTDTDMNRGLDIPKASPESVVRAIFDGVEKGEEDIFPDPMSASMAEGWRSGTDVVHYLSETQGFSTFARDGGTVCHSYSTGARGVEFLIGYYPILDRVPKGRDEGDAFQTWLRRHDEYDTR